MTYTALVTVPITGLCLWACWHALVCALPRRKSNVARTVGRHNSLRNRA